MHFISWVEYTTAGTPVAATYPHRFLGCWAFPRPPELAGSARYMTTALLRHTENNWGLQQGWDTRSSSTDKPARLHWTGLRDPAWPVCGPAAGSPALPPPSPSNRPATYFPSSKLALDALKSAPGHLDLSSSGRTATQGEDRGTASFIP